jgi:hypothetical protein
MVIVCFVPNVPLSGRSKHKIVNKPRMAASSDDKPSSQTWPVGRFLRTALWYSPLGKLLRPPPMVGGQPTSVKISSPVIAPKARKDMLVLVTGAAGGTGKRVVRELLADGSRVRALVRNRDAAVNALAVAGVDVVDYPDRLELIISDLYNLTDEVFEGIDAVIGCTGTRIGPPGDTPDRSMYMQGLKFFTPTVLDDTPENVELHGVRALVEHAAKRFASMSKEPDSSVPVLTFDKESFRSTWNTLDDVVMGGVSESKVALENGELVFSGNVSEGNNGGFASARSVDFSSALNLGKYEGLRMRVKGDGKRYKIILRCDAKWYDGWSMLMLGSSSTTFAFYS